MSDLISSDKYVVVVGAGLTGQSLVRYLSQRHRRYFVFDSRDDSSLVDEIKKIDSSAEVYLNSIPESIVANAQEIILSPGVAKSSDFLHVAIENHVPIVGDIDLFLRENTAPVVGITGSNGKTTVTTMVAETFKLSGKKVAVGGNIGTPALDLLGLDSDIVVLELSSFQLETVLNAKLDVACILNVTPDHMDRYASFMDYFSAKQRIYFGAKAVVYNLDDSLTIPPKIDSVARYGFSEFSNKEDNEIQFVYDKVSDQVLRESKTLCDRKAIRLQGTHNVKNALALFAICEAVGVDLSYAHQYLAQFSGLPHRCEMVRRISSTAFINDSKATNVGATVSAISSLGDDYQDIVLIAGGEAKGADFSLLASVLSGLCAVVLIGTDAKKIAAVLPSDTTIIFSSSLKDAVNSSYQTLLDKGAAKKSSSSSLVLLSPACASFDMFDSFEDRGEQFKRYVKEIAA